MNKFKFTSSILILSLIVILCGCNSPDIADPQQQLLTEINAIDAQLTSTPDVLKHISGIRFVIHELGDGLPASFYLDPVVDVDYVGKLFTNGSIFDQGTSDTRKVSGFITGWQIALSTLPVGSKATVYIPSYYGYGSSGQGSIPPNSTLVFDMDFKAIDLTSTQLAKFKSDSAAIKNYVDTIDAVNYDSAGMWYKITQETSGTKPTIYDKVKLKYTIKKMSGDPVNTYTEEPQPGTFDSRVSDYLNGIKAGLMHMPEGSKATFYIPSNLAFGAHAITNSTGAEILPASSNIIVDMELIQIVE